MTWLETNSVVPAAASAWKRSQRSRRSTGSRPTVGSSRTRTLRPGEEGAREGDPGALAARQRADLAGGHVASATSTRAASADAARDAVQRRVVAHVLAGRQVGVDRRPLGHVAHAVAQRRRTGGKAQHLQRARRDPRDADDAAHQRGLAAAARPEQAGHLPCGHREREAAQDAPSPELDEELAGDDRAVHGGRGCVRARPRRQSRKAPEPGTYVPADRRPSVTDSCCARPIRDSRSLPLASTVGGGALRAPRAPRGAR